MPLWRNAGIAIPDDLRGKRVAIDAASVADFYLFDKGIERGIYKGQEAAFPLSLLAKPLLRSSGCR